MQTHVCASVAEAASIENTMAKREIAQYEHLLFLPQRFGLCSMIIDLAKQEIAQYEHLLLLPQHFGLCSMIIDLLSFFRDFSFLC